jgi:hypothetical protein
MPTRSKTHRKPPDRAASATATWDPQNQIFTPSERRRPNGIDRTALWVQITLCIVVAALLFSVIALPKFRVSPAKMQGLQAPKPTAERS